MEVEARAKEPVFESTVEPVANAAAVAEMPEAAAPVVARKKWTPKAAVSATESEALIDVGVQEQKIEPEVNTVAATETRGGQVPAVVRKKWTPKVSGTSTEPIASTPQIAETAAVEAVPEVAADASHGAVPEETAATTPVRKKWEPKKSVKPPDSGE